MALANFLDKAAFQASQVLVDYDRGQFESILLEQRILLVFDDSCSKSPEAIASLDLLVRLVARLYPFLAIEGEVATAGQLWDLAKQINTDIETFDPATATVRLALGAIAFPSNIQTFYIGSDGWKVQLSTTRPVGSGDTTNPFGAGAAACWGAANLFRFVFRHQLPYGACDTNISFSLLDGSCNAQNNNIPIPELVIPETVLAGLGAIGNGAAWALSRLQNVTGTFTFVDHERIDLSNLQRYVLALQKHVGAEKVQIGREFFPGSIHVQPEPFTLEEYMQYRGNWQVPQLLMAVDNASDRIMAQGILPKTILNSWTQAENVGISRHIDFTKEPCLCCLYMSNAPKKSYSQEVADNLGIPDQEREVRKYLASRLPVNQALINLISAANGIDSVALLPFAGSQLSVFYSRVVCGGVMLALQPAKGNDLDKTVEVPAAFESALAGILLAVELIRQEMGITAATVTTQFNLMRPFSRYFGLTADKKPTCICNDSVYRATYDRKWKSTKLS